MSDNEMVTLNRIAVDVGKLWTSHDGLLRAINEMAQSVGKLADKLDDSSDNAREALQSIRSMHKRVDEHKTRMDEFSRHYDGEIKSINIRITEEFKSREEKGDGARRWRIGTGFTAAGFLVAATALIVKLMEG